MPHPSEVQLTALQHYAAGDGAGESWACDGDRDQLAWFRHERTLKALERHGWINEDGITEAGRALLAPGSAK